MPWHEQARSSHHGDGFENPRMCQSMKPGEQSSDRGPPTLKKAKDFGHNPSTSVSRGGAPGLKPSRRCRPFSRAIATDVAPLSYPIGI
jgi:hypothetical protein